MDTNTPSPITSSRCSPTPSVFAAAIGPGVGGINTWDAYRPAERHIVIATEEAPVLLTSALRIGFNTTKPESQNTGMDTTQPINSIASSGCFGPTSFTTISANFSAAPVASKKLPTIAPKIITIPMLVKVDEKPLPITVAMPFMVLPSASDVFTQGIPPISPSTIDTSMMDRNG